MSVQLITKTTVGVTNPPKLSPSQKAEQDFEKFLNAPTVTNAQAAAESSHVASRDGDPTRCEEHAHRLGVMLNLVGSDALWTREAPKSQSLGYWFLVAMAHPPQREYIQRINPQNLAESLGQSDPTPPQSELNNTNPFHIIYDKLVEQATANKVDIRNAVSIALLNTDLASLRKDQNGKGFQNYLGELSERYAAAKLDVERMLRGEISQVLEPIHILNNLSKAYKKVAQLKLNDATDFRSLAREGLELAQRTYELGYNKFELERAAAEEKVRWEHSPEEVIKLNARISQENPYTSHIRAICYHIRDLAENAREYGDLSRPFLTWQIEEKYQKLLSEIEKRQQTRV